MDTKTITTNCKQLENIALTRSRLMLDGLEGFGNIAHLLPKELQEAITASIKADLAKHSMKLEEVVRNTVNKG